MNIPYLNLRQINLDYSGELKNAFDKILDSGWYIMGKGLESFEAEYAAFNQTRYCAGLANGLDALILSLKALGVKAGDEVIVPSNTYIASWLAVSYLGAVPVPVEPLWSTCNIDSSLIEEKITPKTRVIMPVNLYGQAAELHKIKEIAERHNLFVLEDNAQAQGAQCQKKPAGSWGHINATSFYPGKNLGALGDAGAITTDDTDLFNQVRVIRNYGSEKKYYNEVKGVNSRLDELQAAFLSVKLKNLEEENKERQRLAALYESVLKDIEQITVPGNAEHCSSVYHIYQLRSENRDALQAHLNKSGIGTMIHYPLPPHLQKAYSELNYKKGDFPIAEKIAETTLSIPLFPGLKDAEVLYTAEAIKDFFKNA